jgi:hypothetical protein
MEKYNPTINAALHSFFKHQLAGQPNKNITQEHKDKGSTFSKSGPLLRP